MFKKFLPTILAIVLYTALLFASESGKRTDLDWGYISYGKNEVSIVSTVDDPPKLRLASGIGVGSGAVSFNRLIDGVERENVLFQGKQDERFRANPRSPASEFTLHLNDGSSFEDPAMVRVLEFRVDTVELLNVKFTKAELVKLKQLLSQ